MFNFIGWFTGALLDFANSLTSNARCVYPIWHKEMPLPECMRGDSDDITVNND